MFECISARSEHAFPQMYFGRQGFDLRNQHLRDLGDYVASLGRSPILVAGDLNVTPWSPHYRRLMARSELQDARRGQGLLPSQSAFMPQIPLFAIPIDHSLVSRDLEVVDMYAGPNVGSDHLPITTDLLLPWTIDFIAP